MVISVLYSSMSSHNTILISREESKGFCGAPCQKKQLFVQITQYVAKNTPLRHFCLELRYRLTILQQVVVLSRGDIEFEEHSVYS